MIAKVEKRQDAAPANPAPVLHQDLYAEQAVIGAALIEPSTLVSTAAIVAAEDFYSSVHRTIWQCLLQMSNAGLSIDIVSVAHELKAAGLYDEIGGASYLNELMAAVPHSGHAEYHAHLVKKQSVKLRVALAAEEFHQATADPAADVTDLIGSFESKLQSISEQQQGGAGRSLHEILLDVVARIEAGETKGLGTGLSEVDEITTGMHEGQVIVIAARPGAGKTALAMSIAYHLTRNEIPVLFHSLEMPEHELGMRILSLDSGVPVSAMMKGDLTSSQHQTLAMSANTLFDRPLHVDDRPGVTMAQIAASAKLHVRKHGVKLLIVDYLQLVSASDAKLPREQQVSQISRGMKLLAKSLGVPILLLSQLSREVEKRKGGRPMLSDLRESGAIEQDADQVWMLHRQELYEEADSPEAAGWNGIVEVLVRKNRNGQLGEVKCQFEKSRMLIRNLSHDTPAPSHGDEDDGFYPWSS